MYTTKLEYASAIQYKYATRSARKLNLWIYAK